MKIRWKYNRFEDQYSFNFGPVTALVWRHSGELWGWGLESEASTAHSKEFKPLTDAKRAAAGLVFNYIAHCRAVVVAADGGAKCAEAKPTLGPMTQDEIYEWISSLRDMDARAEAQLMFGDNEDAAWERGIVQGVRAAERRLGVNP